MKLKSDKKKLLKASKKLAKLLKDKKAKKKQVIEQLKKLSSYYNLEQKKVKPKSKGDGERKDVKKKLVTVPKKVDQKVSKAPKKQLATKSKKTKLASSSSIDFNAKEAITKLSGLDTVEAVKAFTSKEQRKTVLARTASRINAIKG